MKTGQATQSTPAELRQRIASCFARDRGRLFRALKQLPTEADARAAALQPIHTLVDESQARVESRRTRIPPLNYPQDLPVVAAREELLAAIAGHQVIIVCGETGSGKTTQLPKLCLELGRGVYGFIGHTQPRRIAARSVANRIAEELKSQPGEYVGFKTRFADQVNDGGLLKLMTDGILLAELQHDRWLNQYDTLIIDEAHERSLNIDFLLGVFK